MVTFHGAVEWALDYILLGDVIWLPTETQLRELLERYLTPDNQSRLQLYKTGDGYVCEVEFEATLMQFESFGAEEAYAKALRYFLEKA